MRRIWLVPAVLALWLGPACGLISGLDGDPTPRGNKGVSRHDPQAPEPAVKESPFERGLVASTRAQHLKVYRRPRKPWSSREIDAANPIGQRLRFLVMGQRTAAGGKWLKIQVPERPNGSTAWVRRAEVSLEWMNQRIEIDLSKHKLKHFKKDRVVNKFSVGTGTETYPTPKGLFYVWARVPQPSPSGPYGRYALGISGFSPVLSDWPGGGRAAIHGTANPADRGTRVSHGCVRVYNDDMQRLERIPMGTPVWIHR